MSPKSVICCLTATAFVATTALMPRVNQDGSWMLRSMTGPSQLRLVPPLNFRKMCLWIRGDYKIADVIPWDFTSAIFEWPSASGVPQWLEGATYRKGAMTQDEWISQRGSMPPDVVTCSPQPHKAAMIFNDDGTVTLKGERLNLPSQ
jgi:hypothetical protein